MRVNRRRHWISKSSEHMITATQPIVIVVPFIHTFDQTSARLRCHRVCVHSQLSPLHGARLVLRSQRTARVCNPGRLGIKAGRSSLCTHLVEEQMVLSSVFSFLFFRSKLINGAETNSECFSHAVFHTFTPGQTGTSRVGALRGALSVIRG